MKILKNNFDYEIEFDDLEKARKYYLPSESVIEDVQNEEYYVGPSTLSFESYVEGFFEYYEEIKNASSLEELADVLNRYTDIYDNGSYYFVKEI